MVLKFFYLLYMTLGKYAYVLLVATDTTECSSYWQLQFSCIFIVFFGKAECSNLSFPFCGSDDIIIQNASNAAYMIVIVPIHQDLFSVTA